MICVQPDHTTQWMLFYDSPHFSVIVLLAFASFSLFGYFVGRLTRD